MPKIVGSSVLATALIEEGLVPEGCRDIELLLPVSGAVILSYRVLVHVNDLDRLSRAFAKAAERAR